MSLRSMVYVEGLPEEHRDHLILVNETFGGYQIIGATIEKPEATLYSETSEKLNLKYNDFYPRDRYTLLATKNDISVGVLPLIIDHGTLKIKHYGMVSQIYRSKHGGVVAGVAHSLEKPKEFSIDIPDQGNHTVKKDELRELLRTGKLKQLTNDLLYDPESRVVVTVSPEEASAFRLPEGWKPFASHSPGYSVYVVRDNIPYGSTNVTHKDIGVSKYSDPEVQLEDGDQAVPIPVLGSAPLYTSDNGKTVTIDTATDVPKEILDQGLKYVISSPNQGFIYMLTQENNLYMGHARGGFAKMPSLKQTIKFIGIVEANVHPEQSFNAISHLDLITHDIHHYTLIQDESLLFTVESSNEQLDLSYATKQLIPHLLPDGYGTTRGRVHRIVSEVC